MDTGADPHWPDYIPWCTAPRKAIVILPDLSSDTVQHSLLVRQDAMPAGATPIKDVKEMSQFTEQVNVATCATVSCLVLL